MQPDVKADYESALAAHLVAGNGPAVAELLPRDPLDRYARGFNRHMAAVDAAAVGVAYQLPLAAVAAKVSAGKIADVETLFKVLTGILKRTALKLASQAGRKARPPARSRRRDGHPPRQSPTVFAPAGVALDRLPGREPDPSFALERRELLPVLLAGARGMGRLPLRVFREVRAFGTRQGTQFGAFPAVARLAVLDAAGRVVAIRPHDPNGMTVGTPARRVVRQVRRLYQTAVDYLSRQGRWRGRDDL